MVDIGALLEYIRSTDPLALQESLAAEEEHLKLSIKAKNKNWDIVYGAISNDITRLLNDVYVDRDLFNRLGISYDLRDETDKTRLAYLSTVLIKSSHGYNSVVPQLNRKPAQIQPLMLCLDDVDVYGVDDAMFPLLR